MNSTNHQPPPRRPVDDRELWPFRRKCDRRRHRTANRRSRAEAIRNRDRWTPRENNRHNTSRRQQPERTPDPGHPKQFPPQGSSDRDWRRSGLWCLPGLALCCSSRLYSTAAHARMGRAIWPLSEAFLPLSLAVRPGTLKQVNGRSNHQPTASARRSADERRDALFRQYPDVRAPDGPGRTQAFARALANGGQRQCERSSSPLTSARYLFD
jgi:hypothetical protein